MCEHGPVGGACFLLVFGAIIYTAAFVSPTWYVTEEDEYVGLWIICDNVTCFNAWNQVTDNWFHITGIIASVAMATYIFSIGCMIGTVARSPPLSKFTLFSSLFFSIATAGLIVATLVLFWLHVDHINMLSYSYALSLVSAAGCLIVLPLTCLAVRWSPFYDGVQSGAGLLNSGSFHRYEGL